MKTRLFMIFEIVIFVAYIFTTISIAETESYKKTNERPIILKGLSIGMDINEARKICEDLLRKNWIVSQIDNRNILMDDYLESFRNDKLPIVGKRGFLIKNKGGYIDGYGFISDDDGNGKVAQITFSGELTDYIFLTEEVHADYFVEDFTKNFGLPDLPWIRNGWAYSSPYGYELTIMRNKSIDIKKSDPGKPTKPKRKIKFD
jgi:hypothetical protein